jgi:hypothetical protein
MSGEIEAVNRGRCLRTVCLVCPADAISLVPVPVRAGSPAGDGLAAGVLRQTG